MLAGRKLIDTAEAASMVSDGDTVYLGGTVLDRKPGGDRAGTYRSGPPRPGHDHVRRGPSTSSCSSRPALLAASPRPTSDWARLVQRPGSSTA